jgi:hypothetical protein
MLVVIVASGHGLCGVRAHQCHLVLLVPLLLLLFDGYMMQVMQLLQGVVQHLQGAPLLKMQQGCPWHRQLMQICPTVMCSTAVAVMRGQCSACLVLSWQEALGLFQVQSCQCQQVVSQPGWCVGCSPAHQLLPLLRASAVHVLVRWLLESELPQLAAPVGC